MKVKMASVIMLVAIGMLFCISCSDNNDLSVLDAGTGIALIREESFFCDYMIQGDKIFFTYAVVLENYTTSNFYIEYYINASFSRSETKGWLGYQRYYEGHFTTAENSIYLKSGEKKTVVLQFEGDYLGGAVNTNMKPPTELMMLQTIESSQK